MFSPFGSGSRWPVLLFAMLPALFQAGTPAAAPVATTCAAYSHRQNPPLEAVATPRPGWQQPNPPIQETRAALIERTHLVFLGDSLTARWPRALWEQEFGRYGALNLGVGGDRTEWLLWRLQATQWGIGAAALRPRLAVLLIGTNNLSRGGQPENLAAGIQAIINLVQERSPSTRILLLNLWPRSGDTGLQHRLERLNEILSSCADPPRVTVLDLGAALRGPAGQPDERLYVDGLHLSLAGYARVAELLAPSIAVQMDARH